MPDTQAGPPGPASESVLIMLRVEVVEGFVFFLDFFRAAVASESGFKLVTGTRARAVHWHLRT